MDINTIWRQKKELAKSGREYWLRLLKEYDVTDKDAVMILLERDSFAAHYLLEHGDELVKGKEEAANAGKYQSVTILTDSQEIYQQAVQRRIMDEDGRKQTEKESAEPVNLNPGGEKSGSQRSWIKQVILCNVTELESLWELYQVYKFSDQIIWGTLEGIEDANGYQLEGYHGITREQLIRTAIMGL